MASFKRVGKELIAGVPVYDKATDEAPTLILWFLDSRASVGIDDLDLYELKARWVDEAVAKYIEREADRMEKLVSTL